MRLIPGRGVKPARLLFLGEAPARYEELHNQAFVGPAGWELDKWLSEAGIPHSEYWIDNVIPYRPAGDDAKSVNLSEWSGHLSKIIIQVNPQVIVPLGGTALKALLGLESIGKWRGSVLEHEGRRVVPTYHSAYVINPRNAAYDKRWISILDLKKAWRESLNYTPFPNRKAVISPQLYEVELCLDMLLRGDHVTIDIERWRGQVSCIGLGNSPEWAICIPFVTATDSYWGAVDEQTIWRRLDELFRKVPAWGQNLSYDIPHLRRHGFIFTPQHDAMNLHACLWPELPHSLEFQVSIYTMQPYYKDEGKESQFRPSESLWNYNCTDVMSTDEVIREELKELEERGLMQFYIEQYQTLHPYAIQMQLRGVEVDHIERQRQIDVITPTLERVEKLIEPVAGKDFNSSSPKQRADLLYTQLGLPPQKHPRTNKITTDEDALTDLAARFDNPILHMLIRTQNLRKTLQYLNPTFDEDGRLRSRWHLTKEAGRWSTTKTAFGTGISLHTIPRPACLHYPECKGQCPEPIEIRHMILADPGYIFVEVEQRQAEAIIAAALAEDDRMFEWAMEKTLHQHVGAAIFKKRFEDVVNDTEEYELAKRCVHGSNYGMGPHKFARLIKRSMSYGKSLREQYHRLFPGIEGVYHQGIKRELQATRKLVNPFGRERIFLGRLDADTFREAYAQLPQSTVSDLTKRCMPPIWRDGVWIAMEHHDGFIAVCPDDRDSIIKTCARMRAAFASHIIRIAGREFTIPIDIKVGKSWGSVKAYDEEGSKLA